MYTVGKLAKRFGLSRSTLLYYDSIGLLTPSWRSEGNYRVYSEEDVRRLEQVCMYRDAGVKLKDICGILDGRGKRKYVDILGRRLRELNEEIGALHEQQQLIIRILTKAALRKKLGAMDKRAWTALLEAAGLDEEAMRKWHRDFETQAPESHQAFLESLGIPQKEIVAIRRWSAKGR